MNLSRILNTARRYLWLFLLIPLVASLTTYFAIGSQPAIFEAKTRLLVGPSMNSPSPDLNSLKIGGQLIQTYSELVISRPFMEAVNNKLDQKIDPESLAAMIETRQNADTRILTILVRHRDPNQAVVIANAAATTLLEMSPSEDNTTTLVRTQIGNQAHMLEQIISNSEASIQELEAKLIVLGNVTLLTPEAAQTNSEQQKLIIQQLADERARSSDALRTLTTVYGVMREINTNQLEIVEPAGTVFPVNQNLPLRVAVTGAAGLILAIGIIFTFENFDDTIRFPGEFKRIAQVPLLSTIDKHERPEGSGLERVVAFAQPESRIANNYRTAVAKLLFSIGESMPYTYLLSSVGSHSGDDTVEIAANLAVTFAQAGNRVILVDAQFHNPGLTNLFEAEGRLGLADFLATNSPKYKLIPVKETPRVRFLPAGLPSETSSSGALNSARIGNLVEELQKEADIVLVAGAPIAWFAESLTLASQADGVILVAQHGEAHGKIVKEVIQNLSDINVQLAGIIFDDYRSPFISKVKIKKVSKGERIVQEESHI
jgi:capsular polysaccharide biosynthesis protein